MHTRRCGQRIGRYARVRARGVAPAPRQPAGNAAPAAPAGPKWQTVVSTSCKRDQWRVPTRSRLGVARGDRGGGGVGCGRGAATSPLSAPRSVAAPPQRRSCHQRSVVAAIFAIAVSSSCRAVAAAIDPRQGPGERRRRCSRSRPRMANATRVRAEREGRAPIPGRQGDRGRFETLLTCPLAAAGRPPAAAKPTVAGASCELGADSPQDKQRGGARGFSRPTSDWARLCCRVRLATLGRTPIPSTSATEYRP
jgi:hypothetical protein